jgi:AmmeMemoRadiSam system protein A
MRMIRLSKKDERYLLGLARQAIKSYLDGRKLDLSKRVKGRYGVFVSLKKDNKLRGCIGNLEGVCSLEEDIVRNAVYAAFYDPRFLPLEKDEVDRIKIEISILEKPVEIKYNDVDELIKKIKGYGVLIEFKGKSATFLPQVWDEIKDGREFLSYLCLKGGLDGDVWKREKIRVFRYKNYVIRE